MKATAQSYLAMIALRDDAVDGQGREANPRTTKIAPLARNRETGQTLVAVITQQHGGLYTRRP